MLVGVSGGIAAYKACELVRGLRERGAHVVVVLTLAGAEFVTPLTFQTLSGNPVVTDLWGDQAPRFDLPPAARAKVRGKVAHVDLAEAADVVVLAPATADLMARLVHGEAPDALTTLALASRAPWIVCPAMDAEMWTHSATRDNVAALRRRGVIVLGPERGPLASGLVGPGRLVDPAAIVQEVERVLALRGSMAGLRVLVGAGRTEEALDPVRVLTNRSSGRMGVALAEAARDRGAEVRMVAGPMDIEAPGGVEVIRVRSAAEMGAALAAEARTCDVVLMAAAVADYRPARAAREKLKRSDAARTVELVPNEDLLAKLAAKRRSRQILVGFALETSDGVRRARAKLVAKGVDLIVLNAPEHSLGRETNRITLVERARARRMPERPKRELADAILARVLELRAAGASTTSSRSRTTRRGRAASPRSRNRRAPGAGAA